MLYQLSYGGTDFYRELSLKIVSIINFMEEVAISENSGFDLRRFQNEGEEHEEIKSIVGKILSGREGYEVLEEKKKRQ